jgi:hypothetical protein
MTINTTSDARSDTSSDPAIGPSPPGPIEPGLEVPPASLEPDLESRIKLRRTELIAQLRELRTDRRVEARDAGEKLRARLSDLAHVLKWGVVNDWTSVGYKVKHRLEQWLAESTGQSTQGGAARITQS